MTKTRVSKARVSYTRPSKKWLLNQGENMKLFILNALILLVSITSVMASTQFEITYNAGYGEKPTYSELVKSESISSDRLKNIFNYLLDGSELEFN